MFLSKRPKGKAHEQIIKVIKGGKENTGEIGRVFVNLGEKIYVHKLDENEEYFEIWLRKNFKIRKKNLRI